MARNPAEGVGDSRSHLKDPYRAESPSTTDASAGRIRTASRSGIQGTSVGSAKSRSGSKGN